MTREQIDLAIFRTHILSQALIEAIDDLKGTPFYRHRVKSMANTLQQAMIADINNTITDLYGRDEELMMHMSQSIDAITESLVKDSPAVIASYPMMIQNIRDKYNEYEQSATDSDSREQGIEVG
jgi:hypothetical protein